MLTSWLKKHEFCKNRFLSIRAFVVGSNLRNSSQSVSTADRDRRQENSGRIFSEQMFTALIWSILNLKEKSGEVIIILAKLNSFPSHVVNKHSGLEDPLFSRCGHAGRHSGK